MDKFKQNLLFLNLFTYKIRNVCPFYLSSHISFGQIYLLNKGMYGHDYVIYGYLKMPPQGKVSGLIFAITVDRVDLHVCNCALFKLVPNCSITELVTNYVST